jgi:superfamily II DNA or RNA helicase
MELRPFQDDIIRKTRLTLRRLKEEVKGRKPRILIQCPTGGGKTVISAFMAKAIVESRKRLFFNCHRDFLVDQTSKTYARLNIDHSFIAAGRWYNQWHPAHICMVQSIPSRFDRIVRPDYVFWDEAHHIGAKTWEKLQKEWPDAVHIGFSATPQRLDGKGLDAYFDAIILGPSVHWLMRNKYLSDYRAWAPSSPDLTGVQTRHGDYVSDQLEGLMDRSVIIGDMVRHYQLHAAGTRAVYFCTSVKHSQHVAASFTAAGIPARHLDGTHKTWERRNAAVAFADGELMVLTNVDLFGEGYDLAAQAERDVTIECVGMARPTQSVGLFMQQIGRAFRPKDYPAILLDHAGNLERHGLPDDDREWSLKGIKKKPGNATTTKRCPECFAMNRINAVVCIDCGTRLAERRAGPGEGRQVDQLDGDLQEVDKVRLRKARKLEEWQAGSLDELVDIAKRRGYNNPEKWAGFIWTSKQNRQEAKEYAAKQQMEFFEQMAIERYGR